MALAFKYPYPVTEEFVLELSRANPLMQIETTAQGVILMSPPTASAASSGEVELTRQLANWNERYRLGRVLSCSGGITLPDGAIKAPDATWISHARWNAKTEPASRRAFVRLAPDAVFEICSPSESLRRLHAKMREYLCNGVLVAVLLNPRDRTVRVYRAGCAPERHENPGALPIPELPEFRLDARHIFEVSEPD